MRAGKTPEFHRDFSAIVMAMHRYVLRHDRVRGGVFICMGDGHFPNVCLGRLFDGKMWY